MTLAERQLSVSKNFAFSDIKNIVKKRNFFLRLGLIVGLLLQARSDMIKIEDKIQFIKRIYRELQQGEE